MDDIVPSLLETIQIQFDERIYHSANLKKAIRALKSKKATYLDANNFAIEVGEILAGVLSENITGDILPDGKMYYNIADRILNTIMKRNHELISGFSVDVQELLNQQAKIGIKTQMPALDQDRIDGLVNRLSSEDDFEKVRWILDEPIVNFSQSIVDDSIKMNADFHAKSGLKPKLVRSVSGHACEWCQNLAGSYDYYEAPDDIYRRHDRCRCNVDYKPGDGRRQDVWSKAWRDPKKKEKIEKRKQIGLKNKQQRMSDSFDYIDKNDFADFQSKYGNVSEVDSAKLYDKTSGYIGTSNSYRINKMLRGEKGLKPKAGSDDTIKALSKAIESNTLRENVKVDRWVKQKWLDTLLNDNASSIGEFTSENIVQFLNSGKAHFEEKGFVSTSLIPDKNLFTKSHNVRMHIEVPKGTKALVTENAAESEMILSKGSKYKIIKAEVLNINGREIHDITVKLIKE